MARAVAQRKQIPSALIVFVFLFFVASVLAIVFYMQIEDEKQKRIAAEEKLAPIATDKDLIDPKVKGRVAAPPRDDGAKTVVSGYGNDVARLTKMISGNDALPLEETAKVVKKALEGQTGEPGLVDVVRQLKDQVQQKDGEIRQGKDKLTELAEQRNAQVLSKDNQINELRTTVEKRDADLAKLRKDFNEYQVQHDENMAETRDAASEARKDLDQQIAVLNQKVVAANSEIKRMQEERDHWKGKYADALRRKVDQGVVHTPDGKVVEVVGTDVIYINIGSANGVIPGLTFGVFPPSGKEADQKANIVVTKVHDKTSECRLVVDLTRSPITPDDLIMNIAFNESRPYAFVVEGEFDLYGVDQPSKQGADEIRSLIKQFKGVVSPTITPETDFVVMGAEPERPAKPDEDAEANKWTAYNASMKTYEAYQAVKIQAQQLNVPILNTNRFLALVGHTPKKTLKY